LGQPGIGNDAGGHDSRYLVGSTLNAGALHACTCTCARRDYHTGGVDSGAHGGRDHGSGHLYAIDAIDVNANSEHIGRHMRIADANSGRFGQRIDQR
jgi:hypothetical protein